MVQFLPGSLAFGAGPKTWTPHGWGDRLHSLGATGTRLYSVSPSRFARVFPGRHLDPEHIIDSRVRESTAVKLFFLSRK
jgi:hypothetical protein